MHIETSKLLWFLHFECPHHSLKPGRYDQQFCHEAGDVMTSSSDDRMTRAKTFPALLGAIALVAALVLWCQGYYCYCDPSLLLCLRFLTDFIGNILIGYPHVVPH